MSEISDNLRAFADTEALNPIQSSMLKGIADRADATIVELPRSADGKIWTGREACFWTSAEREGYHRFDCVALRNGKWHVESIDGMDYEAESVWYERPDSLERIVEDIEEFGNEADINDAAVEFLCKIQRRIYELAEKEN